MANEQTKVIAGIDTHADTHHVAVITDTGRHMADREFPAAGAGYQGIIDFITGFGPVLAVGVEGTGSYGAELSRVLVREGIHVVEVMRPNRHARRLQGKSDPLDAYQAAESVLAGRAATTPGLRPNHRQPPPPTPPALRQTPPPCLLLLRAFRAEKLLRLPHPLRPKNAAKVKPTSNPCSPWPGPGSTSPGPCSATPPNTPVPVPTARLAAWQAATGRW
ncbi:hypothetical protein ACVWYS_002892 [Arthrobacter sp. TE12231]